MPAVGFKCPNDMGFAYWKNDYDKQKCSHCPNPCMARPALQAAAQQRPWKGKPSVTQLIQPTLPTYLAIVKDYFIEPMGTIASMIGTNSHQAFENAQPNNWLAEVRLEDDITSGQFDAYDTTTKTLWDWKFFGAFRIAKALGYTPRWTKKIITRGKNKGQEKWEQVFEYGGVRDIREIAIQLNYYRYLMEKQGLEVKNIKVNMFIRGGLDATAKRYGLTQPAYIVPINFISKQWVRKYMVMKYDALMRALEEYEREGVDVPDFIPSCLSACNKRDRWDNSKTYPDRKCRDWCNVHEFCPYWQENYGGAAGFLAD